MLTEVRRTLTKAQQQMLIATLEDTTGSVECIVFPKTQSESMASTPASPMRASAAKSAGLPSIGVWSNLKSPVEGPRRSVAPAAPAPVVVVAGAIFSHGVSANGAGLGLGAGMGPWLVASLVWGIGLSLGGTTGYAINPARDLGPRLVHWLAPIPGKGGSNWSYAYIPIVGPLLGGGLAGVLVRYAHL